MNKQLIVLLSLIFTGMVTAFLYFYSAFHTENELRNSIPLGDKESIVYLGNEGAKNEFVFLFDYSCLQCFQWVKEVYPNLQELVEEGEVKLRTQSLVFNSELSFQLATIDQNLKYYYPSHYFKIFPLILAGANENELNLESIINEIIALYQLDEMNLAANADLDVIHLTRSYTKELKVDSVPSLLVNGEKIEDPFSLEEILQHID